ncbi:hypothetical protein PINS_up003914 [Pythium insidiosum]|nr:hypothetical protein PINS_up003914 [Pythium insidiosum]
MRARVSLQEMLRVPAVASYARNFDGEREKLQDILEIALCYGIHCLSRNFQLKGITVDELRNVTKFEKIRSLDFFVRGTTRSPSTHPPSDPQPVYRKPPHSWRDGDRASTSAVSILSADSEGNKGSKASSEEAPEVYFAATLTPRATWDEIEFYTTLLGKRFVDVAWATYSARSSAHLDASALDERMRRLDQRKQPSSFPSIEFPVCSFVEFLHAYIKTSVMSNAIGGAPLGEVEGDVADQLSSIALDSQSRAKGVTGQNPVPSEMSRPKLQQRREKVSTTRHAQRRKASHAGAYDHVPSKIQPDLQAKREKLLRIKKTQTQLMKESLARARLAEYETRQRVDSTTDKRPRAATGVDSQRMPLRSISPGAAALEIVDGFMTSPILDKFSGETAQAKGAEVPRRNDPIREELYGTAALDDSFIGCRVPSERPQSVARQGQSSTTTRHAKRDFSGWLGDFGPPHTKTVRPSWEVDAASSDSDHAEPRTTQEGTRKKTGFEWNLDM